jgi:2-polyprenyl-3-methyl-5-hydroxy-6-metoxy-1,4-benzoquinol methylase
LELVNSNSLLLILEQIKKGSTILEFGPANGRMTKYLKEQLDCRVYLAELEEAAGKEALQYGVELVVGDVENYEWFERFQDIKFDYIVYADVLEHLRDPQSVIAKSKMLLKNDGSILLSVPNFAHNAILINLLNNNFQYRNVGLLDNTHIHMFTKNSLENMLHDIELFPVKRMATYSMVGKNEIPADIHWNKGIDDSYWNQRQYGEVYQFVYEVKKGKEFIEEEVNDLKDTMNHYYVQIYKDYGDGLSEEKSIKKMISTFEDECVYVFDLEKDVERYRIDPVNHKGLVDVKCYQIKDGKKELILPAVFNYITARENCYCFESEDPWMLYDNAVRAEKIEVHIKIQSMSAEVVESIKMFKDDINRIDVNKQEFEALKQIQKQENEKFQKEKKELEEKAEELKQRIHVFEENTNQLKSELGIYKENRKNLENKFLYKLYKKVIRH